MDSTLPHLYKPRINQSVIIMDLNENFVVTSKYETGADFAANFAGPIRVQKGHKIALKTIFYGQIFNVTTKNNLLLVSHKAKDKSPVYELFVEPGFYASILSLTETISRTINNWIDDKSVFCAALNRKFDHTKVEYEIDTEIISLDMKDHDHLYLTKDKRPNVLNLIDIWNITPTETVELLGYEVKNGYLTNHFPAFVYASVIENSYINGEPSRLLAVIPIQNGFSDGNEKGYHFYEFSSPTYYNFGISEFSHIKFYILDMDGQPLEFDPTFQTVMNLEVFKPLNII